MSRRFLLSNPNCASQVRILPQPLNLTYAGRLVLVIVLKTNMVNSIVGSTPTYLARGTAMAKQVQNQLLIRI